MPHRERKTRKQRGSRTMGYGRVGQHRKSGGRGGKGKAGGRKHFWIRTVKYEPDRYKSIGFKPPSAIRPSPETINVGELEDLVLRALGADQIRSMTGALDIDLAKMGYGKLLGQGEVDMPLRLKVPAYTPTALKKVEEAGGEIVQPE